MQGQTLQGLISRKCLIDDSHTALNAVHFFAYAEMYALAEKKTESSKK